MRCRMRCATFAPAIRSVALHMHQGSPHQIAHAMLLDGNADVGIATEALAEYDELRGAAVLQLDVVSNT